MNKCWLTSICFLCFLFVACGNEVSKESGDYKNESKQEDALVEREDSIKVVASEKNLPANFTHLAFEREQSPSHYYLVHKVENQKSYEEVWALYRLARSIPKVNLEKNDLYFIALFESGSCPYELDRSEIDLANQVMNLHLLTPNGSCTLDASPRTFVVEVSKESSSFIHHIVINEGNVETTVPLK